MGRLQGNNLDVVCNEGIEQCIALCEENQPDCRSFEYVEGAQCNLNSATFDTALDDVEANFTMGVYMVKLAST